MARTVPIALQYELVYNQPESKSNITYRIQYPLLQPERTRSFPPSTERPCKVKISELPSGRPAPAPTAGPKRVPECELVYNWRTGRSDVVFINSGKSKQNSGSTADENAPNDLDLDTADAHLSAKYYLPEDSIPGDEQLYAEAVDDTPLYPSQFETVRASEQRDWTPFARGSSGRLVFDRTRLRGRPSNRGPRPRLEPLSVRKFNQQNERPRAVYNPATHRASLRLPEKIKTQPLATAIKRPAFNSSRPVVNGQQLPQLDPLFVHEAEDEFLKKPPDVLEDTTTIDDASENRTPCELESSFCEELEKILVTELEQNGSIERRSPDALDEEKRVVMIGSPDELDEPSTSAQKTPSPVVPLPWYEAEKETVFKLVFNYLPRRTLCERCMLVCRQWHDWIIGCASIWKNIDLNGRQDMSTEQWRSIALRRPENLNLAWTCISKDDLRQLLSSCDRLTSLSLAGCHFSTVIALKSLESELNTLDLRWVQGCTDANFKDLVSVTPKLKNLSDLYLSGCDVGDATARLLANQFGKMKHLDLSYCSRITNLTLDVLGGAGSRARRQLVQLNLAGCQLDGNIFGSLQKMASLEQLDLRACQDLNEKTCNQFEEACAALGRTLTVLR